MERRHASVLFTWGPKSLRQKGSGGRPKLATAVEGSAFRAHAKEKADSSGELRLPNDPSIFFSLRESALRARRRWRRLVRRWRRMRCRRLLMLCRRRRVGVMVQRRMHIVVVILRLGGWSEFHRWTRLRRVVCSRPLSRVRPV